MRQQHFATLDSQYQAALQQITQDYEATLQALTAQPSPQATQHAETAYQTAREAQQQVYQHAQRQWHKLYRHWHAWMLQQQAQTRQPSPLGDSQDRHTPQAAQ
jgi:hypothetical protein